MATKFKNPHIIIKASAAQYQGNCQISRVEYTPSMSSAIVIIEYEDGTETLKIQNTTGQIIDLLSSMVGQMDRCIFYAEEKELIIL